MSEGNFMKVIDVNLRGVFICTKQVADLMIEQGHGGRIINVTSADALHPDGLAGRRRWRAAADMSRTASTRGLGAAGHLPDRVLDLDG